MAVCCSWATGLKGWGAEACGWEAGWNSGPGRSRGTIPSTLISLAEGGNALNHILCQGCTGSSEGVPSLETSSWYDMGILQAVWGGLFGALVQMHFAVHEEKVLLVRDLAGASEHMGTHSNCNQCTLSSHLPSLCKCVCVWPFLGEICCFHVGFQN